MTCSSRLCRRLFNSMHQEYVSACFDHPTPMLLLLLGQRIRELPPVLAFGGAQQSSQIRRGAPTRLCPTEPRPEPLRHVLQFPSPYVRIRFAWTRRLEHRATGEVVAHSLDVAR